MLFYGVSGSAPIAGYGLGDAASDCMQVCGECGGQPCDGTTSYDDCTNACTECGGQPCGAAAAATTSAPSGYANACEACLASSTTTDCTGPCGTTATTRSSQGGGSTSATSTGGGSSGWNINWNTAASAGGSFFKSLLSSSPTAPTTPTSFLTSPAGIGLITVGLLVTVVLLTRK